MTTCDLGPTVVGRAFGALEPDEEDRLDEHLAGCVSCRQVADDAQEVAVALGRAVPQADPPPQLRERVLAAARAEPDPPRRPAPAGDPGAPEVHRTVEAEPAPSGGRSAWHRRSRSLLVAVAGAVIVGIGLLGIRAVVPTETGPGPGDPTTLAQRAQRVVDGAQSREPGTRHATLRGGDGQPMAVVLAEAGGARVVPLAMSRPAEGQRYVLWATGPTSPVAVATVDTAAGTTVPLPGAAAPLSPRAYAVSVEPTGPVPDRPTTIMAVGPLV